MKLNKFQKGLPVVILELADKYELTLPTSDYDQNKDFWKCHGKWIIKHDGCEIIAKFHGIKFEVPTQNYDVSPSIALLIKGTMQELNDNGENIEKIEWSFGEANGRNTKMPYWWAMAEKRGKDRVILKLINAYEKGLYSEVEADEWKENAKIEGSKKKENPKKEEMRVYDENNKPVDNFEL